MAHTSFVYLVQECGSHLVKIGYSKDPYGRLPYLQLGNPRRLEIVAVFDGGRSLERSLHREFEKYAVGGEWFDDHDGHIRSFFSTGKMARRRRTPEPHIPSHLLKKFATTAQWWGDERPNLSLHRVARMHQASLAQAQWFLDNVGAWKAQETHQ